MAIRFPRRGMPRHLLCVFPRGPEDPIRPLQGRAPLHAVTEQQRHPRHRRQQYHISARPLPTLGRAVGSVPDGRDRWVQVWARRHHLVRACYSYVCSGVLSSHLYIERNHYYRVLRVYYYKSVSRPLYVCSGMLSPYLSLSFLCHAQHTLVACMPS